MKSAPCRFLLAAGALVLLLAGCSGGPAAARRLGAGRFTPLFPRDGIPTGWRVGQWNEVSKPVADSVWRVTNGVLHGGLPRGSWLMSEKQYGDFILEYEFKLGPTGNSGCALRAPMFGDPAFDGMELQMADYRYNTKAKDSELAGGIYRALAPRRQVYKPEEWNSYRIELRGSQLKVVLNGELIHDTDLATQTEGVKRHDNSPAVALKDRPRRGHLGFQELSRGDSHVMIRHARIMELR
jgi:hypothetical protein